MSEMENLEMFNNLETDDAEIQREQNKERPPLTKRLYTCGVCFLKYAEPKLLEEHLQFHFCSDCGESFENKKQQHPICHVRSRKKAQMEGSGLTLPSSIYSQVSQAHRGTIATFQYKFTSNFALLEDAYDTVSGPLLDLVYAFVKHYVNIRVKLTFYLKLRELKTNFTINRYFNSPNFMITHRNFVKPIMEFLLNAVISQLNLFHNEKSGYALIAILENSVSFIAVKQTTVGSYLPMPKGLAGKKGYLSIKTTRPDQNCFILSILNSKFFDMFRLDKHPEKMFKSLTSNQKIQLRKQMQNPKNYSAILDHVKENNLLNLDPFNGPISLADVDYFESLNKVSITIFAYNRKSETVHPIRITTAQHEHQVALLMIKKSDLTKEQRKRHHDGNHFVLITDPSRFFCNGYAHKRILCFYCANMISKTKFDEHVADCKCKTKLNMSFPTENCYKFKEHYKLMSMPYRLVVDAVTCLNKELELTLLGFSLKGFGPEEEIVMEKIYFGHDCIEKLAFDLVGQARLLLWMQTYQQIPLKLSKEDDEAKRAVTECPICHCQFSSNNVCVSHHSHFVKQEKFRDPNLPNNIMHICQKCNLALSVRNYILVVMQGFHKGILHKMLGHMRSMQTNVIVTPRKNDDWICLQVPNLFKTFELKNFVDDDLATLVNQFNIETYAPYFEHYNAHFEIDCAPYYFPSGNVIDDLDKSLPENTDNFFDLTLGRNLNQDELEKVLLYCTRKSVRTLREYAEHYLKFRVHAINAVTQALNRWALTNYKLSIHYDYSLAGFSWSACMFNTQASFEYVKSPQITEKVLTNIIGGISHLATRYLKANSPRLGHTVPNDDDRVELLCVDLKSAYSFVMCDKLPYAEYELIEGSQLDDLNVWELDKDPDYAHFINVDLYYPSKCKPESRDFPYCPEKLVIDKSKLADHHRGVYEEMNSSSSQMRHVILTQSTKRGVLLHQKMLFWYLNRGLKLAKVHYLIRFRQKAWLRPHVERCTALRYNAKNQIEKRLVKSTINMVYGKAYGGAEMYSIRFCDNASRCKKLAALPEFYDVKVLNKDLSIFYVKRKTRMFDKNLCLAMAILQLSHLNYYTKIYTLKDYFKCRMSIAAGETDSLVASIKDSQGSYISDLKNLQAIFDFSNLDVGNPLFSMTNSSQSGIFQIEHFYAVEFVKLKSKNYAIKSLCKKCKVATDTIGNDLCSVCNTSMAVVKGAPKNAFCPFDFYISALKNEKRYIGEYYSLKKRDESLKMCKVSRTILAVQDFRRQWAPDSITSVPFGHDENSNDDA